MGWKDWLLPVAIVVGAVLGGIGAVAFSVFGLTSAAGISGALMGGLYGAFYGYMAQGLYDAFTFDPDVDESSTGADSKTYGGSLPVATIDEGIPQQRAYGRPRMAGNIFRSNDPDDPTYIKALIGHSIGEVDEILTYWINNLGRSEMVNTSHAHTYFTGTTTQKYCNYFADDKVCNYRGLAYTGLQLAKGDEIRGLQNVNVSLRALKCLDIGQDAGGTKSWTRNPAQIIWDWYIQVEKYAAADLDENAFTALASYCSTIPAATDSVPVNPPGLDIAMVNSTNNYHNDTRAMYALTSSSSLVGTRKQASWVSASGTVGQTRIVIDFGIPYACDKLVLENYHASGIHTDLGVKNFVVQTSNNSAAFANTSYVGEAWTKLSGTTHVAAAHPATDTSDPQEFSWTNTTPYRYYSVKIQDNNGNASYVGLRNLTFYGKSPRYTFDYVFDCKATINDAKKTIWKAFNGACIMSQGKIKPVWDAGVEHDAAGGLQTKVSQFAFTIDSIVKDSLTWGKVQHPNIIRVHYANSHFGGRKDVVEIKDERDISNKGEIIYEEECWWIIDQDVASRRAQFKFDKSRTIDYVCQLTGIPSTQGLEIFDLVTVSHPSPDWSGKQFLIRAKSEDEYGRPIFQMEAYFSGIYHDLGFAVQESYGSKKINPLKPPGIIDCSDVTIAVVQNSLVYSSQGIQISFTPPADPSYTHTEVYLSTDDITFRLAATAVGTYDVQINGMGTFYYPGDSVYVRLKPVSSWAAAPMPSVSCGPVVITDAPMVGNLRATTDGDGDVSDLQDGNFTSGGITFINCCLDSYVAPTIVTGSTDDTIDSTTPATVTIENGCSAYRWAFTPGGSSKGYTITGTSGVTAVGGVSVISGLTVSVGVVAGTCGVDYDPYCSISVTDYCESSVTKTVRCVTDGAMGWELDAASPSIAGAAGDCGYCVESTPPTGYHYAYEYVDDIQWRYRITYGDWCRETCGDWTGVGPYPPCGDVDTCTTALFPSIVCGDYSYYDCSLQPLCRTCISQANRYYWVCS